MIYRELNGNNVSALGFGTMRLPMTEDGRIDEAKTSDMIKLAIDNGVNYFDTAYPYHGGEAEPVLGRILKQYPRDSYYLATKYPGHQIAESFNPAETFEEQVKDNLKTFETAKSLSDEENAVLMKIADDIKNTVPCTACRYCCDDCPQGIDIPLMMDVYNDLSFSMEIGVAMRLEGFPEDKQPSACINCGKCARLCPQSINIPEYMKALDEMLGKIPKWVDICRQRDEA